MKREDGEVWWQVHKLGFVCRTPDPLLPEASLGEGVWVQVASVCMISRFEKPTLLWSDTAKHFEMSLSQHWQSVCGCTGCSLPLPPMPQTVCFFVFATESRLVRYEHMIPPLSNWLCYSVSANLKAGCHRTCAISGSVKPTRGTQNFSNGHEWGEGVHVRSELCVMWSGRFGGW